MSTICQRGTSCHLVQQWRMARHSPYSAGMAAGPSLTERRKQATLLEIAEAAAELFADQDTKDVTVEAISSAAGVSIRTFYRYFQTKEEAVTPLLTVGAQGWQAAIADSSAADLRGAIGEAITATLTLDSDADREALKRTRGLLRAAMTDQRLAAVWRRVNGESEERLRDLIVARKPDTDAFAVRLLAAAATDAIRVTFEDWAASEEAAAVDPVGRAVEAFDQLSAGIEGL